MATFNKFNLFVENILKGGSGSINLATDTVKVMLTNTAPVATNNLYGDVSGTELGAGNGYATGGGTVTGTGVSNSSGTESVAANAFTWTSVTGNMGPFRYAIYYDFTATSPLKPLIGWYDYGSALTLNGVNGDTFTITPAGNVLFTLV